MGREHPLASLPFGLQWNFLRMCGQGGLLTSRIGNMWSRQGLAFSFNRPTILILEFPSIGNDSPIALPSVCLVTQLCLTLCDPMDCCPPGPSVHGDSPGKHTGVGWHALLQGIFPTQGSNPGLLLCRQILYHLSHQGSPLYLGVAHLHPASGLYFRSSLFSL